MNALSQSVLHGSPLAGLCAFVLVHVPLSRLRHGQTPILNLFRAAAAGGLVTLALALGAAHAADLSFPDAAGAFGVAALTYTGLAWCYFNFVNLNLSSLRFRLLRELRAAPDGLEEKDIVARYNADHIISRRLHQLTAGGHLVLRDGRFTVGNPFLLMAFDALEVLKLAVLGHGSLLIQGAAGNASAPPPLSPLQRSLRIARIVWSYTFLRFILVGVLNTAFSYCGYTLLVLIGVPYNAALTLMTIVAQLWNFMTTGHLVFGNRRKSLIFKFLCVGGSVYLLNLASLTLLVEVFQVGELAAQAVLIPLVITASFLINRAWVFRAASRPSA